MFYNAFEQQFVDVAEPFFSVPRSSSVGRLSGNPLGTVLRPSTCAM